MSAELYVRSEVPPLSWEEFKQTHPVGSIALDGYVGEGPEFEYEGPYYNANHHEGVKRLATLSTAQQILMDVQMGLDKPFTTKKGIFAPNVFVNDCDQDVCAAWFLLDQIDQTRAPSPALKRFINIAGTLDVTAGAFPYDPDMRILRELAWVFEPYGLFRASGEMAKKDNRQYYSVIEDVQGRIQRHLMGRGNAIDLDSAYELVGGGKDWQMIREIGRDGRVGALMDGIDSYVSVQELPDGRWRYTVGRRSEFVPFDVPGLMERLNQVEGCTNDRWGGATIVGGSPRVGGSKLSPAEVEKVINEHIASKQS